MKQEPELFFEAVVREDRSILDFLDSDYTFVNERLAKHYGIEGVQGPEFRRVSLERWQAGRRGDNGVGLDRHVEPDPDLAREARQVDPRRDSGHATTAASAGDLRPSRATTGA